MPAPPSPALSPIPPSPTAPPAAQSPSPTPTPPSSPASQAPAITSPAPTTPATNSPHRGNPRTPTEPDQTAPRPGPRPPRNTSQRAQHTTPRVRGHGEKNSRASTPPPAHVAQPIVYRPATPPPHRPPASPDRTCAAAHCPWDDHYNLFPPIQHLLAATAPRSHAHQQATEPQEPDHVMQPRSISPAANADQNAEHQRKEPNHAATSPPPPPQGHLRHTSRHPGPPHGRRAVLPIRPTRDPCGPRDPPGVEAGERERQRVGHGGRPSLGRRLERHQEPQAPPQPDEEIPQAPSPRTAQESHHKEPLTHPITTTELQPQHRTTPDRNRFWDLPREWAVHNGTLRWEEITPRLQAISLHSITEPTITWTLRTDRHHLLLNAEEMPPSHQRRETP